MPEPFGRRRSRPVCRLASQVISGRQDRDPAKRVQVQQIPVVADDDIGAPVGRDLKKLVIIGIAGGLNPLHDLDDFDEWRKAFFMTFQQTQRFLARGRPEHGVAGAFEHAQPAY